MKEFIYVIELKIENNIRIFILQMFVFFLLNEYKQTNNK